MPADEPIFLSGMEAARHAWPALGALLLRDGLVEQADLEAVLADQAESGTTRISGKRLGETLVDRGLVTSEQVARLVAEQYELPFVDLEESELNVQAAALLTSEVARRFAALPIAVLPDDSLLVAVADPTRVLRSDDLRRTLARPLRFAVATPDALEAAISSAAERAQAVETTDDGIGVPVDHVGDPSPFPGASARTTAPPPALGTLLVRDGLVTEEDVEAALAQQRISGSKRLGEILVERGSVTRAQIARLVAEQYELPYVDLDESDVDRDAAALLPEELARRHSALPVGFSDDCLLVVIGDPTNTLSAEEIRLALNGLVRFAVADPGTVQSAIDLVFGAANPALGTDVPPAESAVGADDSLGVDEAIRHALLLDASDIHFTPQAHAVVVRARIDGVMRELEALPSSRQDAIAERLRRLGELSPEGRGTPHGSPVAFPLGDATVDLRMVAVPTKLGEKVTLHARRHASAPAALVDVGMPADTEDTFRRALLGLSGAVLVCGPAESGRTTTLYAALQELNTPERTLSTIESPIEHLIAGVDQTEVDPAVGLTFASGLHAILESDPDVVLVGELSDADTSRTALQAALAGRFVLAALHAETATTAFRRLVDIGVEPGLLGSTVRCIVAQRLIRRVCPDCRESYYATAADLAELDREPEEAGRRLLARGVGCDACAGTGFRGRAAIFEALLLSDEIRDLVARRATSAEIEHAAIAAGMRTLREDGVRLCLEGVTTAAELRRIVSEITPQARSTREDPGVDGASARA
jgi:type IV pilus assembly protein PilB